MIELICYKIPFLSVLIKTIFLSCFVLQLGIYRLILKKKSIFKYIHYFIFSSGRNIQHHVFSCLASIMTWNKFNQINLFQIEAATRGVLWKKVFAKFLRTPFLQNTSGRLLLFGSSHRRCFVKRVFLKFLHVSQENIRVGVSL